MYFKICSVLIFLLVQFSGRAADYYISTSGSDSNPGTEKRPFATVKKAVSVIKPGDTCYLRGGRYREVISLNQLRGNAFSPITICAYPGEKVILDGTEVVRSKWKVWRGRIYYNQFSKAAWQLFVDNQLVQVARWPNASHKDGSIWRMQEAMRYSDRGAKDARTKEGLIYDKNPPLSKAKNTGEEDSWRGEAGELAQLRG